MTLARPYSHNIASVVNELSDDEYCLPRFRTPFLYPHQNNMRHSAAPTTSAHSVPPSALLTRANTPPPLCYSHKGGFTNVIEDAAEESGFENEEEDGEEDGGEIETEIVSSTTTSQYLLAPQFGANVGKKTIVLDLDETLVHSTFKPCVSDVVVPVHIDGVAYNAYVNVRPYAHSVLRELSKYYELVIFTASIQSYAEAVINMLDTGHVTQRLYRDSCTLVTSFSQQIHVERHYAKDLSQLGRALSHTLIIDNSPACVSLQPENGILVSTWTHERDDIELLQLQDILLCDAFLSSQDLPLTLKDLGEKALS